MSSKDKETERNRELHAERERFLTDIFSMFRIQ
jgi:hypothetical protein